MGIYKIMKTKYPVIGQYDALLQQRKNLTGYYFEKIDRKIQETTKSIMADKKLMDHLKQMDPQIASHIFNNSISNCRKDLAQER